MKLHPRVMLVQQHKCEFNTMLLDYIKDRDITYTELLCVIHEAVNMMILKYMLRDERHPDDPEKRSGEE